MIENFLLPIGAKKTEQKKKKTIHHRMEADFLSSIRKAAILFIVSASRSSKF